MSRADILVKLMYPTKTSPMKYPPLCLAVLVYFPSLPILQNGRSPAMVARAEGGKEMAEVFERQTVVTDSKVSSQPTTHTQNLLPP